MSRALLAQSLRRQAAELLLEAERIERRDARPPQLICGDLDGDALADLLDREHTLHLAFSASAIKREPGERPLPRGDA